MKPEPFKTPSEQRGFLIYYARVLLREASARRQRHRGFSAHLLASAGRARREAAIIDVSAPQGDLFGGVA